MTFNKQAKIYRILSHMIEIFEKYDTRAAHDKAIRLKRARDRGVITEDEFVLKSVLKYIEDGVPNEEKVGHKGRTYTYRRMFKEKPEMFEKSDNKNDYKLEEKSNTRYRRKLEW